MAELNLVSFTLYKGEIYGLDHDGKLWYKPDFESDWKKVGMKISPPELEAANSENCLSPYELKELGLAQDYEDWTVNTKLLRVANKRIFLVLQRYDDTGQLLIASTDNNTESHIIEPDHFHRFQAVVELE